MIDINLLPWRAAHRKKINRQKKISMSLGVLLGIIIWIAVHWVINAYLRQINLANDFLNQALQTKQGVVDEVNHLRNQHDQLLKKLNHIEHLHRKQKLTSDRFSEIVLFSELPVDFKQIHFSRRMLGFKGQAHSLEKLTILVNRLNQSQYFQDLQMKEINRDLISKQMVFEVHMGLKQ